LLEGRDIRLRVMEKDDVSLLVKCINKIDFYEEYGPITQVSKTEAEKQFENPTPLATITERVRFVIEKKDGTKIGVIAHYFVQPIRLMEIGYVIIPSERRKGYGTEAVQIMVDYLFLSKDVVRIQALTDVRNKASQRVLEKTGFQKEGVLRKVGYVRGKWADACAYSTLREEWKKPKILTKTASQN